MIVCETKKELANATNSGDAAGAVAVKEYVAERGILTPSTKVKVNSTEKTLQAYVEGVAEDQAETFVEETFSPNIIKAAWTATESSAYNTALTAGVNVPAGTYLIIAKTPFSELETTFAYLRIGNVSGSGHTIYTGENIFHPLVSGGSDIACIKFASDQTGIVLAAGESASLTWDSQYLSRGGLIFIRIGA